MKYQTFRQKMKAHSVLLVEDDPNVQKYIAEFLSRYCMAVYAASNSEEGWKLYREHRPDILLLDIQLPKQSGISLAETVRMTDAGTRILLATAYTNTEFMLQAIELDITRYLVKPVTHDELVEALKKCLDELDGFATVDLGEGYVYSRRLAAVIRDRRIDPLRRKEAELLEFFIEHAGQVVRYEGIEEGVWRDEVMTRDAIRSQIRNLRKKIAPGLIKNVASIGYRFEVEA